MDGYRPAWLTDDEQWREQLAAIPEDEAAWITEQWDLAACTRQAPDLWVTTETIGTSGRTAKVINIVGTVLFAALIVAAVWAL
jgi:hypothetical protein